MKPLVIDRLRIGRMPGVTDGGYTLDGLAAGLNVIHGPNASGKTTTARAIEALLWPRAAAPARSHLSAAVRVGDESWSIEVDGGSARYQRDGVEASALQLPPPESRDRYRLSLHELLREEDAGFARAIATESTGGYDLQAAAEAVGARPGASKSARELAALKAARGRVEEARRAQDALLEEERVLRDLERRLALRGAVDARIRLLERAVEHARARVEQASAARELAGYDPRRERLHGEEAERLRDIETRRAARAGKVETARAHGRAAEADLAATGLPATGLPGELIPTLREALDTLRAEEQAIATREREAAAAGARREGALRAVGGALDEARLAGLETGGVEELAGFARAAERLAADRAALEARLRDLTPEGAGGPDRERIENGIRLLHQWLRAAPEAGSGEGRLRMLGALAAAGLVAAGLALALLTPALALAAVPGVVLLYLILRTSDPADPRPAYHADYGALALEQPDAWTPEAVASLLDRLHAGLASARLAEEAALRRADYARRLDALEPEEGSHAERRAEIAGRLGVDPETSDGSLVWLVERIGRWHDARAEESAAGAALEASRARLAETAGRAAARIAAFATLESPDASALAGTLADLEARQSAHREARARRDQAVERTGRGEAEVATCELDRRALLERLGVEESEARVIDEWCAGHDEYRTSRERLRLAESRCREEAERLAAAPGYDTAHLAEPEESLAAALALASGEASELAALHDEATTIRTHLAAARKAHAMEDALAEAASCEEALREARDRDVRAVLAGALVKLVHERTRDQHLPDVFHRARALFSRITHGRYRLDLHDREAATFRAYDETTGVGHSLGELSSGSRIQLLLAVRLAFVETQEGGVRLPLVLDETLGNSDDARAAAIMEAIVALAGEGRQVFYFTAQPDEVGKWRGLLESHPGVPFAVVDLAEKRRLARRPVPPGLRVVGAPERVIPQPVGMSHAEYGEALHVPAIGPLDPVDSVHLWHLVDDPAALYPLLMGLGVERWGALRSLVEHGGQALIDRALYSTIEARARALECALRLLCVGRGRPMDRAVLVDSGLISDAFIDAVAALCHVCGGDARRLVEALTRQEVKGFRTQTRESFQEYLESEGYLDDRETIDPATLRARTLAAVADDVAAARLTVAEVDRLLGRLDARVSDPSVIVSAP